MDLAPLSDAHGHARKAAVLTQSPNLAGAREEHERAAQDFAKAKNGVGDSEALRILELLEQHHQQLADIIKSHSAPPKSPAKVSSTAKDGSDASKDTSASPASPTAKEPHVPKLVSRTSTSPVRTRRLHRETSSSIADNLARQRRGLPANPELSNLQAGGRILSHIDRPGYSNNAAQRPPENTRTTSALGDSRSLAPAAELHSPKTTSDDSFSKFYSTFGGLFEKLSGPLAFTGLPLTTEQAGKDLPQEQPKKSEKEKDKSKDKTRAASSDEPDLAKIYSAAALKAIQEDAGTTFGPQESFYLVPPTGGTISYAGMVSGGRPGTTHIPDTINEDDDEFVDARESMGPPSPRSLRSSATRKAGPPVASRDGRRPLVVAAAAAAASAAAGAPGAGAGKTPEELELEITVLKQLLDTQAKRLQMWEMSSQSQSMALQQSMRAVRQRPDLPSVGSDASAVERMASADEERIQQLEAQLKGEREERAALEARTGRVESENKRLTTTVGRYRDKWEQLKAGARKREDDKRRRQSVSTGGGDGMGKNGGKEEGDEEGVGEG